MRKPSPTAAERRYVYHVLATTLSSDLDSGAEWLHEDPVTKAEVNDATYRRRVRVVKQFIEDFRKKSKKLED